ncbi:MAG: metallophosphoesterase [Candidatus Electrothrix sp. AR3]|nr:metallophosphoesterase [Candidatus Electrothrix sp. AR3]
MSSIFFLLRIFAIVGGILTFLHYYLWRRLVKDPGFNNRVGTWAVLVLLLSFPASRLLAWFSFTLAFPLLWLSYLWLGMLMLFFFLFLFTDCLKILYHSVRCLLPKKSRLNPSRRQFLSRCFAFSASILVMGISAWGVKKCIDPPTINQFKINMPGLPKQFKGFKIVQISDIHIGELLLSTDLEEIVTLVNSLEPDIVAITGDLVDGDMEQLRMEISPLSRLQAKEGIFFVTGNHEYYSGVEQWLPEIEKLGIRVLDNRRTEINRGGESFIFAGVNDHQAGIFGEQYAPDFSQALAGIAQGEKIILLAHQPIAVREAAKYGVDLMLSGHMHGGQIWPFRYLTRLQQPYLKGFYRRKKTLLFVNQGTGYWGPPMRVGTYKEITEFVLN